jgi:hypothetical protein
MVATCMQKNRRTRGCFMMTTRKQYLCGLARSRIYAGRNLENVAEKRLRVR